MAATYPTSPAGGWIGLAIVGVLSFLVLVRRFGLLDDAQCAPTLVSIKAAEEPA